MVPFCLKSYNIVAPYENLDDDYASKIGKSAVAFTPEVTISESEIAELEKPKVKEVIEKTCKIRTPSLDIGEGAFPMLMYRKLCLNQCVKIVYIHLWIELKKCYQNKK